MERDAAATTAMWAEEREERVEEQLVLESSRGSSQEYLLSV